MVSHKLEDTCVTAAAQMACPRTLYDHRHILITAQRIIEITLMYTVRISVGDCGRFVHPGTVWLVGRLCGSAVQMR